MRKRPTIQHGDASFSRTRERERVSVIFSSESILHGFDVLKAIDEQRPPSQPLHAHEASILIGRVFGRNVFHFDLFRMAQGIHVTTENKRNATELLFKIS